MKEEKKIQIPDNIVFSIIAAPFSFSFYVFLNNSGMKHDMFFWVLVASLTWFIFSGVKLFFKILGN